MKLYNIKDAPIPNPKTPIGHNKLGEYMKECAVIYGYNPKKWHTLRALCSFGITKVINSTNLGTHALYQRRLKGAGIQGTRSLVHNQNIPSRLSPSPLLLYRPIYLWIHQKTLFCLLHRFLYQKCWQNSRCDKQKVENGIHKPTFSFLHSLSLFSSWVWYVRISSNATRTTFQLCTSCICFSAPSLLPSSRQFCPSSSQSNARCILRYEWEIVSNAGRNEEGKIGALMLVCVGEAHTSSISGYFIKLFFFRIDFFRVFDTRCIFFVTSPFKIT